MPEKIVVAVPSSQNSGNSFNPDHHLGWISITIVASLLINLLFNIFKYANEKNIGDIVKEEFKPLVSDVKELKVTLTTLSNKIIELEAQKILLKQEITAGCDRIESKLNKEVELIDQKIEQMQKDYIRLEKDFDNLGRN